MGVQVLVRVMAAGLGLDVLVELDDGRVLVRLAHGLAFVFLVEGFHTGFAGRVDAFLAGTGLAAAGDAAAGAAHDFDEVVGAGAGCDLVHQLLGAGQAAGDGDLDFQTFGSFPFRLDVLQLDGGFLDLIQTNDGADVQVGEGQLTAGDDLVDGTQGSFHNAAGQAEDVGRAGGQAQRIVEFFFRQSQEVDAGGLDHVAQLAGGEDRVHVLHAVVGQLGTGAFGLLGGAGHDGDDVHLFGLLADLFGVVALDDGAHHLMRGFAGAQMAQLIRIMGFDVLDPAGGAGGHHGQDHFLAGEGLGDALQELGAFFHDGQVGGPVGVEHGVEAQTAQGRGQTAGLRGAGGNAEAFADAHADGGSGLHDHVLVGVVDGGPDAFLMVGLFQSANGADHGALTAESAVGIADRDILGGADQGLEAAVLSVQDADFLDLVADADAAAAEDALGHVAGEGFADVDVAEVLLAFVAAFGDAQLQAQSLQFAGLVAFAGQAVAVMVGDQQLVQDLAGFAYALGIGEDLHTVAGFDHAGGLQTAGVAHFLDHADTAGAELVDAFQIAQAGDMDAVLLGRLEDGASLSGFAFDAIDGEFDHFGHGYYSASLLSG